MSRSKLLALALCLPLLSGAHWSEQNDPDVARGQEAYGEGDYAGAVRDFGRALSGEGERARLHYNLGTGLLLLSTTRSEAAAREKDLDQAIVSLLGANAKPGTSLRESVDYNLANAFLLRGRYSEAVALYRRVLVGNADHDDARYNLQLAMMAMRAEAAGDSILAERLRAPAGTNGEDAAAASADSVPGPKASQGQFPEPEQGQRLAKKDAGMAQGQGGQDAGPEAAASAEPASEGEESSDSSSPASSRAAGAGSDSDSSSREAVEDLARRQPPDASRALSLKKKLDALERRSAELRRASIYRKTNSRVRNPEKKAKDQ